MVRRKTLIIECFPEKSISISSFLEKEDVAMNKILVYLIIYTIYLIVDRVCYTIIYVVDRKCGKD